MRNFGIPYIVRHQEDTTGSAHYAISPSAFTAEPDSPWRLMYAKDKYARDRVMKAARLLLPYLKDNDTVLDVGCFTQEAKKYFPRTVKYIGIDEKAYHPATKVVNLHHGFEPIPCQHAMCLETLEHLLDPEDTLKSISESIPLEGLVVVSLPNESTLFHRLRCLYGVVDAECFSGEGKHLHLPDLNKSRKFLLQSFLIVSEKYYISPSACGSQYQWFGKLISLIPDKLHQLLADMFPSLFARGFIFLLKKKPTLDSK